MDIRLSVTLPREKFRFDGSSDASAGGLVERRSACYAVRVQHPRLKLLADRKRSTGVDEARGQAFLDGEIGLAQAVGTNASDVAALRRQAQALFAVRRPSESIVILHGLFALGEVLLDDVVLMMLCHEALGDDESARLWSAEVDRLATMMDAIVGRRAEVQS